MKDMELQVKKERGKLIWFHAASIGESLSIITLIKEIQKKIAPKYLLQLVQNHQLN